MRNKKLFTKLFQRYRRVLQKHDFSRAQTILGQLKSSHPSKGWYHHGLFIGVRAFFRKTGTKTVSQQIACFQKSLAYDPKYESAWRALGMCYFSQKQYSLAEKAFQNSLRYARNDIFRGDALRLLSDVTLKRGDVKKAFRLLNKIFTLKKRPPYFQLADHFIKYYQITGDRGKIREWAKRGIMSARIVEKSGKQAYGDKVAYQKIITGFQKFL